MSKTKIEWADMTINPVVGCSKCSPGCDNCYAEKMAYRLSKMPQTAAKYAGVVDENGWTGVISDPDFTVFSKLPKAPQRVFVGSMCDIFHEHVHIYMIRDIMEECRRQPQHAFMFLTKRPEWMRLALSQLYPGGREMPSNVWLGVTVCNQAEADAKIPILLQTPATKRFVSVEPMLGPVDLKMGQWELYPEHCCSCYEHHGESPVCPHCGGIIAQHRSFLDWVICGGETGPKARSMHPDWARGLRDQCVEAGVPYFFKGWGEWVDLSQTSARAKWGISQYRPFGDAQQVCRLGKKRAGRLLDGREWNEVPQ